MHSNLVLIQLISEQTMQNLLPVLALRPRRVIHLCTARTAGRSAQILSAARLSGLEPEMDNIRLTDMPSIPEAARAVLRAIDGCAPLHATPVVNFTGGTKLMSIGAYESALSRQASSLYVDTANRLFVDGHTGPKITELLGDDLSLTAVEERLTVDIAAVANGRDRVSPGRDWQPFLPLARSLLASRPREEAVWDALHGPGGLCPQGREPRRAADWLPLLQSPLKFPDDVAPRAAALGLLSCRQGEYFLPDGPATILQELAQQPKPFLPDYYQAVRPFQFSLAFLTGAWWEVIVADAAFRSGQFRDLRWSASVGAREGVDLEEDLIGLDGAQIACFSCKRGGARARLLSQLDELDNRARSLGGHFTRRFLAVYQPLNRTLEQNLSRRASELGGIKILTPAALDSADVFRHR